MLESILVNRYGLKIPHNRIHRILKDHHLASNDAGKQLKRKWVKYERHHSMSLWHTDWYQIEDDRWRGKWLVAYLDDASRFVVGYSVFDEATAENAISVLVSRLYAPTVLRPQQIVPLLIDHHRYAAERAQSRDHRG